MDTLISTATERNWMRLNTDPNKRLASRANKRLSRQKLIPLEYFSNTRKNLSFVQTVLSEAEDNKWLIQDVLYSLAHNLLIRKNLYDKPHVKTVLEQYRFKVIQELAFCDIPMDEFDLLGLVYQGFQTEGDKNKTGSYYTPKAVVDNMTASFRFSDGQLFLDPCCGSGAFLLAMNNVAPNQLFGIDNDPIAVMIAQINMLLKFPAESFSPQIFQGNYLSSGIDFVKEREFDYIATNPPWGALPLGSVPPKEIVSGETFSSFFVQAFKQLKPNGIISFLFPEAILNVKAHKDIRSFLLDECCLQTITQHMNDFTGVMTKYVEIKASKSSPTQEVCVVSGQERRLIDRCAFYETENLVFNFSESADVEIIQQVKAHGKYSLADSIWALGVVTGDNKNKLIPEQRQGYEAIYTGKEISPYLLKPVKNYLLYDRKQLQQVAKEEYYRASEKLVYKFISKKLVFAYDDSKSLFLNSANILIPQIPGMSIKTVLGFLNSELFQYYYQQAFGEIKILKGNLVQIPFPEIDANTNHAIECLVDDILSGKEDAHAQLQLEIYKCYHFTEAQIAHIRRKVYGTAN